MKRFFCAVLIFILTFSSAACSQHKEIPSLSELESLSDEILAEKLIGYSVEEIQNAWGEPDGNTFGFWADIYDFPNSSRTLFLYYDAGGIVETIQTDYRNE